MIEWILLLCARTIRTIAVFWITLNIYLALGMGFQGPQNEDIIYAIILTGSAITFFMESPFNVKDKGAKKSDQE